MFCDGKCIKGRKECGQLFSVMMENTVTGKIEEIKKCSIHHLIESNVRLEQALIRIQAAVEDLRNEESINETRTGNIVATGMLGMMHAFNQDYDKFKKSFNLIQASISKGEQKIIDIQNHRTEKLKCLK